jgi:hypothetical protein
LHRSTLRGDKMFKNHAQTSMFTADQEFAEWVGADSFYGFLAKHGHRLFPDSDFESLYTADNGRPCASPCMLTKVMLLQIFDRCSDAEAVARASYDLRWKVALGVELANRPFAKSTLQAHRARLHLSGKFESLLQVTLEEARRIGVLKRTKLTVAVDTTPVFGRGAVKDTYNLVADGIKGVCRALSTLTKHSPQGWAFNNHFKRYWDSSSVKAMAEIDWSNAAQRQTFLQGLVADVDRILVLADAAVATLDAESTKRKPIADAAGLLRQLVAQDIERTESTASTPSTAKIREEVARDRMPSVHDPEMRHGRKSASKRFDGHKMGIAVDTDSQMITAVEVHAGNTGDATSTMDLVKASETNTGLDVETTIGDCAYGSGETRREFADADRELVAKVPSPPKDAPCHKSQFDIDIDNDKVTCPAGHTTTDFKWVNGTSTGAPVKQFYFPKEVCAQCPLRAVCFSEKQSGGRTVTLHEQESLLQAARKSQVTPEFRQAIKDRQVVEHRLARMVQLGVRQARYVGRSKTKLQCTLVAVVANLTRLIGFFSCLLASGTPRGGLCDWLVRLVTRLVQRMARTSRWVSGHPPGDFFERGLSVRTPRSAVPCRPGGWSPARSSAGPSRSTQFLTQDCPWRAGRTRPSG